MFEMKAVILSVVFRINEKEIKEQITQKTIRIDRKLTFINVSRAFCII